MAFSITNVPPVVSCILVSCSLCNNTIFFIFLFEAQSHSGTRWSSSLCRTRVATIHGGSVRKTLLCLKKRLQPRGGRTNGCRQSRTKPVPRGSERGGCEILFSELLPEQTPSWDIWRKLTLLLKLCVRIQSDESYLTGHISVTQKDGHCGQSWPAERSWW